MTWRYVSLRLEMNWPNALLAGALALFGFSVAVAQTSQPPAAPAFKNLQVLPADISREQLMATMKTFSQSLGVRCSHCHVGTEGQPLSTFDFASDDRPAKEIARRMMRMTWRINDEDFGITEVPGVKVTCFTCHRGSRRPLTEAPETAAPN